jgi:hypothetical protein
MTKNRQIKIFLQNTVKPSWVLTKLKGLLHNPKKNMVNSLKNLGWSKDQIQKFMQENNLDSNFRLDSDNYLEILQQIYLFESKSN